jgi:hypothetical protein
MPNQHRASETSEPVPLRFGAYRIVLLPAVATLPPLIKAAAINRVLAIFRQSDNDSARPIGCTAFELCSYIFRWSLRPVAAACEGQDEPRPGFPDLAIYLWTETL